MFAKIALPVLALALAAPAFGATQLEQSLDVDAGVYSLSELTAISGAETEREAARLKAYFLIADDAGVSRAATAEPVASGEWVRHPGWEDR